MIKEAIKNDFDIFYNMKLAQTNSETEHRVYVVFVVFWCISLMKGAAVKLQTKLFSGPSFAQDLDG